MFNRWKMGLMFLVLAAALGLLLAGPTPDARGGKPKPPPPPPPGKIVFQLGEAGPSEATPTENWEMNADGSDKQYVAPGLGGFGASYGIGGTPSARKYDEARGRWFLKVPYNRPRELLAYGYIGENGEWGFLQVTKMAQYTDPNEPGPFYFDGYQYPKLPQWSNDGQDSFVSISVFQYNSLGWNDTENRHDLVLVAIHIVRLHISGEDLALYALFGEHPMITPADDRFEIVLSVPASSLRAPNKTRSI